MTATMTERPLVAVGEPIISREQWLSLPDNTRLTRNPPRDDGRTDFKIGTYRGAKWLYIEEGPHTALDTIRTDGFFSVTSFPAPFEVGHRLRSSEEWRALPVGTVLHHRRSTAGARWTIEQHGADTALYRNGSFNLGLSDTRCDGVFEVQSFPSEPEFVVGQRITSFDMFDRLPIGTKFRHRTSASLWEKIETNLGACTDGRRRYLGDLSVDGRYTIAEVPANAPAISVEVDLPPLPNGEMGTECVVVGETVMEFAQRFETTMWGAAFYHGVQRDEHDSAMSRLGAPNSTDPDTWCEGMSVYSSDQRLIEALPMGTLIETPNIEPESTAYALCAVRDTDLTRLLGGGDYSHCLMQIVSFPEGATHGDGSWRQEGVVEDEERRLHEFKTTAYEVGMRVKRNHSWCETFERCLTLADIPASGMPAFNAGQTAEQVAALPVGTIVRVTGKNTSAMFVRDDRMTNPARTRHLAGPASGDWAQRNMHVVRRGGTAIHFLPHNIAEMIAVPDGTTLSDGRSYRFTKDGNRWTHRGNNYSSRDLFGGRYNYLSFPGVG